MTTEILCWLAPFATLAAIFVPPSMFLSQWSGRNPDMSTGRWVALSCLSHLFLLAALWVGSARPQSLDLFLFVAVLMPLPVAANSIAWSLARPMWPRFARARIVASIAASISLLALAVSAAAWLKAPELAGLTALFATVNLLALGAMLRVSTKQIGVRV